MITLALSKGRIFDESLPLLAAAGIEVRDDPDKSRKLILATSRADLRVVLVRASDVPTYVRHGGAHLGVAGLDVLLEHDDGLDRPAEPARHELRDPPRLWLGHGGHALPSGQRRPLLVRQLDLRHGLALYVLPRRECHGDRRDGRDLVLRLALPLPDVRSMIGSGGDPRSVRGRYGVGAWRPSSPRSAL